MSTLFATTVANAKSQDRDYKLSDGGGLYLLVRSNGEAVAPQLSLARKIPNACLRVMAGGQLSRCTITARRSPPVARGRP
jgi:hypothetical protein